MIRPIEPAHHAAILALNAENVAETSPLEAESFAALLGAAFYAAQIGDGREAFLIAVGPGAAYDSPNYRWFDAGPPDFAYVDRIVVAADARRRGHAAALYAALFEAARRDGVKRVVCEVNVSPPNPRSDAFHDRLGFLEVGRADLADRGKTVRYLAKAL